VAALPLVVADEVPLAGLLGRAWDAIRLWIK
jgi:D-alanyl-D-alanine carboxypeptidase (penicillin-binding protein 5/6)